MPDALASGYPKPLKALWVKTWIKDIFENIQDISGQEVNMTSDKILFKPQVFSLLYLVSFDFHLIFFLIFILLKARRNI